MHRVAQNTVATARGVTRRGSGAAGAPAAQLALMFPGRVRRRPRGSASAPADPSGSPGGAGEGAPRRAFRDRTAARSRGRRPGTGSAPGPQGERGPHPRGQRLGHGPDMVHRGAAAAAHDLHAPLDPGPRRRREGLRRGARRRPPAHPVGLGGLGIGHDRPGPVLEQHVQAGVHGGHAAVHDAGGGAAARGQAGDDVGEGQGARRRLVRDAENGRVEVPAGQPAVIAQRAGDADPHRQAGVRRRRQQPRRMVEVEHHLQDQEIDARLGQDLGHFPVVGGLFLRRRPVAGVHAVRARPPGHHVGERARHGDRAPVGGAVPRFEGQLDRPPVDPRGVVGQPGPGQDVTAGGEGVGRDHLGAGADVVFVHPAHDVGMVPVRQRAPGGRVHLAAMARDFRAGASVERDDLAGGQFVVKKHRPLPLPRLEPVSALYRRRAVATRWLRRVRRARTSSRSARRSATQPAVGAQSSRARWTKMALPAPGTGGSSLWPTTTTRS